MGALNVVIALLIALFGTPLLIYAVALPVYSCRSIVRRIRFHRQNPAPATVQVYIPSYEGRCSVEIVTVNGRVPLLQGERCALIPTGEVEIYVEITSYDREMEMSRSRRAGIGELYFITIGFAREAFQRKPPRKRGYRVVLTAAPKGLYTLVYSRENGVSVKEVPPKTELGGAP